MWLVVVAAQEKQYNRTKTMVYHLAANRQQAGWPIELLDDDQPLASPCCPRSNVARLPAQVDEQQDEHNQPGEMSHCEGGRIPESLKGHDKIVSYFTKATRETSKERYPA